MVTPQRTSAFTQCSHYGIHTVPSVDFGLDYWWNQIRISKLFAYKRKFVDTSRVHQSQTTLAMCQLCPVDIIDSIFLFLNYQKFIEFKYFSLAKIFFFNIILVFSLSSISAPNFFSYFHKIKEIRKTFDDLYFLCICKLNQ